MSQDNGRQISDDYNEEEILRALYEDYDHEEVIIGYECINCGHIQDTSISCDACLSYSIDPIFE